MIRPLPNYYKILGLDEEAEPEVVRAAYRELAAKYHPDRGGDPERMRLINEAYAQIADERKRASYDALRRGNRIDALRRAPGTAESAQQLTPAAQRFNLVVGAALAAAIGFLAGTIVPLELFAVPWAWWWFSSRIKPVSLALLLGAYGIGHCAGSGFFWHYQGTDALAYASAAALFPVLALSVASLLFSARDRHRAARALFMISLFLSVAANIFLPPSGTNPNFRSLFHVRIVWAALVIAGVTWRVTRIVRLAKIETTP